MSGLPPKQGLYDPRNEHDACGVGFVANIKGAKSHGIIGQGLQFLINLDHRGAVGADPLVGDGAGILIQIPDALLRDWAQGTGVTLPAARRLCRGHVLPAARSQGARYRRQAVRALHQGEGQMPARLARRADRPDRPGQDRARRRCR